MHGCRTIACTNATGGMVNLGPTDGQGPSYEMRPTGTTNLTWVHGKHTYKAGAEWIMSRLIPSPIPLVTLNSANGRDRGSLHEHQSYGSYSPGFGFASFLLGDMSSSSQGVPIDTRIATIGLGGLMFRIPGRSPAS